MKHTTYKAKGPHEVFIGGNCVARIYLAANAQKELRIAHGMPKEQVIQKLLNDCPDFCSSNGITQKTIAHFFCASKRKTRRKSL